MKKFILSAFIAQLGISPQLLAQSTETYGDAWFLWLSNYQINESWSVGNEFHWRNTNFLSDKEQLLIRPFINYKANESIVYSFGYSYIRSYPFTEKTTSEPQPEHNIWEQVTLNHQWKKFSFSHRYRLEHRFQGNLVQNENGDLDVNGFDFSQRFRYRFTVRSSIGERYYVHAFDEIWIKGNETFRGANLDRNWIYAGIGRNVTEVIALELAYLHQNIRIGSNNYQRHPTVQVTLKSSF